MRSRSLAVGAAAFAVAALGAVPATAATPARSTTTPMCATSQLTAALGGGDGAAGSLFRYLVITNHSRTACHVTGFPGLSMLDAHGKQIGAPATRDHRPYVPVVLRPGASASDTIHTINHQGTCLPTSTSLRIYPPGNRASLVFPGQVTNCDNLFTVTPFTGGKDGNPSSAGSGTTPTPAPATSPTATPAPTTSHSAAATPEPTRQVSAVPSGAPDTGLGLTATSGGSNSGTGVAAGAAAAGVVGLGGLGFAVRRRRRSHSRAQG